ncbi:hypothetical protein [Sphingomonas faeni]|uniref:hypothetical protein n=1 Tax=Sphingomonas faeni TaxID=185950 RepID=UPI00334B3A8C
MPVVPLGTQAYSRLASNNPDTRLVNLYMEEDQSGASPDQFQRLQRPGLTRLATVSGTIRAVYQSDNSISNDAIVVAGDKWFRLNGEEIVDIATVPSDGASVRMEATFERIGLITAGAFLVWDGTTVATVKLRDTLTENDPTKTLTDLPPIVDFSVLNGYFILTTASGVFYTLTPGEASVQALSYADAEARPDGTLAARRLRDDIFFFGADSIEVWQSTGDAKLPFQRASGRLVDRGCMSRDAVSTFDNSIVWVGDDGIVYRMSDVPERISNFGIEERIKRRTDDPSAWVFTTYGHKFYVLRIPGEGTFGFDAATKIWSEFSTLGATVWVPTTGMDTASGALAGDANGKLYRLDPRSSLDDGKPFQRLVTGTIALPAKPAPNSSIAIGVGSDDPAIFNLRWHDPRRGWSQSIELRSRGEGDILNAWRLGVARPPSRTFEISTVSPTAIRISGAVANEGWRV